MVMVLSRSVGVVARGTTNDLVHTSADYHLDGYISVLTGTCDFRGGLLFIYNVSVTELHMFDI